MSHGMPYISLNGYLICPTSLLTSSGPWWNRISENDWYWVDGSSTVCPCIPCKHCMNAYLICARKGKEATFGQYGQLGICLMERGPICYKPMSAPLLLPTLTIIPPLQPTPSPNPTTLLFSWTPSPPPQTHNSNQSHLGEQCTEHAPTLRPPCISF